MNTPLIRRARECQRLSMFLADRPAVDAGGGLEPDPTPTERRTLEARAEEARKRPQAPSGSCW